MRKVMNRKKNHIYDFFVFIFRVMVIFVQKTVNFRSIFTITEKLKKLIFHSIQHIAHLSWKLEQNWGGGVSIFLLWTWPKIGFIWQDVFIIFFSVIMIKLFCWEKIFIIIHRVFRYTFLRLIYLLKFSHKL